MAPLPDKQGGAGWNAESLNRRESWFWVSVLGPAAKAAFRGGGVRWLPSMIKRFIIATIFMCTVAAVVVLA